MYRTEATTAQAVLLPDQTALTSSYGDVCSLSESGVLIDRLEIERIINFGPQEAEGNTDLHSSTIADSDPRICFCSHFFLSAL